MMLKSVMKQVGRSLPVVGTPVDGSLHCTHADRFEVVFSKRLFHCIKTISRPNQTLGRLTINHLPISSLAPTGRVPCGTYMNMKSVQ